MVRFFPRHESKAWCEKYQLFYSIFWIGFMAWIVITKNYEGSTRFQWLLWSLIVCVPGMIYPLLFPGAADRNLPISERHWVKANLWIAIFGFVGNYFWTHYFYKILDATYTMDTYRINDVPIMMFLMTQSYFLFYHTGTNIIQRMFFSFFPNRTVSRTIAWIILIGIMAYVTAFMESFTIASFPYYHIKNRTNMYLIGSFFYGIYFIVSFPMFLRIDEDGEKWPLSKVAIDAFGAAMIVTCLLDFWRLAIGNIN